MLYYFNTLGHVPVNRGHFGKTIILVLCIKQGHGFCEAQTNGEHSAVRTPLSSFPE